MQGSNPGTNWVECNMVPCYNVPVQVKQLADFKTAELNAKVLQLESHIHWLQQENERLREELQQARHVVAPGGAVAAAAADGPALAALQVCMAISHSGHTAVAC